MKGVAAFIKDQGDDSIRLVFNDVEASSDAENPDWKHIVLFTSNSYNAKSLKELSLSKEQFAQIGESLIIRLLALGGHLK
jgi:hypothetical protein